MQERSKLARWLREAVQSPLNLEHLRISPGSRGPNLVVPVVFVRLDTGNPDRDGPLGLSKTVGNWAELVIAVDKLMGMCANLNISSTLMRLLRLLSASLATPSINVFPAFFFVSSGVTSKSQQRNRRVRPYS